MTLFRTVAAYAVSVCVLAAIAGCNRPLSQTTVQSVAMRGNVLGGQQPVTGSVIQLYETSATGNATASKALIAATVTTSDGTGSATDSNANAGNAFNSLPAGFFTITGDFTCDSPNSQVYIAASGGNPGLASGTNNTALQMIAPLGACAQLSAATTVDIDEVTTVGAVAALYPYMASYSAVGSASTAAYELANQFSVATEYINAATGLAPGPNLPSGYYASSTEINTLADVISSCVNSASASSTLCAALFQAATPPSGTAPTDTVGALIDILNNPTGNVNTIFSLASSVAPFQPSRATAPSDWTLPILPAPITPAFSLAPGTYAGPQTVSIVSPVNGTTVYYTTNGATPTTSSSVYTSALTVSATETVKAIAVGSRAGSSPVSSASYTIAGAAATPVISPAAGTYTVLQLVTISSPTPDAAIYYTVDGTTPTAASNLYVSGLQVAATETVKAVAIAGSSTSAVASAAYTIPQTSGTIETIAGPGASVGDNGPATGANIGPAGVAVDSAGNLYIADTAGSRVRKVAVGTGIVTTVAGNGTAGYSGDNGPATSAEIYAPAGIALDTAGNLYIADRIESVVRKVVLSTGTITTVAGNGTPAYAGDNGPAASAELKSPYGVAVDASGNLYIADSGNSRVREVAAATGTITTIAGTGTAGYNGDGIAATAAKVVPYGVAVDASGNVYIADYTNDRVREVFAATGTIQTVAGTGTAGFTGDNGPASTATLHYPFNVAVDASGDLYISDYYNRRIREVAAVTGTITTIAGTGTAGYTGDNGPATSAELMSPYYLAVDTNRNVYIGDTNAYRVREVAAATGTIATVAGSGGTGFLRGDNNPASSADLSLPAGVVVDAGGNAYIVDTSNNQIRKVSAATGIITTVAGNGIGGYSGDNGPATGAALSQPAGLALDASGNLYIADTSNNRIRKVAAGTGTITTVAGNGTGAYSGDNGPATGAELSGPTGLAFDGSGNLYIADSDNNRVRMVAAGTGTITTVAGNGAYLYSGDGGPATGASLGGPTSVAVDGSGNLYIADTYSSVIRKVAAGTGTITTIVGTHTPGYTGDGGMASSAELAFPFGVALDGSGNLYIADTDNDRIRKVSATTGTITTVAGSGVGIYNGDGIAATAAGITQPRGICVDANGRLYIADTGANRIRVVYP